MHLLSRRTIFELVGIVVGFGSFLLRYANKIANALQFIDLPDDVKQALIAMSQIPTLLAWLAFVVGLLCLGYLIHDSHGNKVKALATKRVKLLILAATCSIVCLVGAAASITWSYRLWTVEQTTPTAATDVAPNPAASSNAEQRSAQAPAQKPAPLPVPKPKEENLIGSATLLFNADDDSLTVLKYEGIKSVAVEPINNLTVMPQSYVVTFIFYPHQGPFDVRIDGDVGVFGRQVGLFYSVSQNDDRFVSVNVTKSYMIPRTHQTFFRFYRQNQAAPSGNSTGDIKDNHGIITQGQTGSNKLDK
jgi:hypothetical protein